MRMEVDRLPGGGLCVLWGHLASFGWADGRARGPGQSA
jgi:hypothetical protein